MCYKYMFEDEINSDITQLLRKAYSSDILENFIHCRGNSDLVKKLHVVLRNSNRVVVFMDVVPGNQGIYKAYNDLKLIMRKNTKADIILMPLVCAEYYLIKSLKENVIDTGDILYNKCINLSTYFSVPEVQQYRAETVKLTNTGVVDDVKFRRRFGTIEKLCKYVLATRTNHCVRDRVFFSSDCLCENVGYRNYGHCGTSLTMEQKAAEMLLEYPAFPEGMSGRDFNQLSSSEIWDIHRKCIDRVNKLCDILKADDCNNRLAFEDVDNIKSKYRHFEALR